MDYFIFKDISKVLTASLISSLLLLSGCADRTRAAPVVTLSGSTATNNANKVSIKAQQYKVKAGETLYSIAWRSGNDVRNLAAINNLKSPYQIFPGQILNLNGKHSNTATSSHPAKPKPNSSSKNSSKSDRKVVANEKTAEYGDKTSAEFSHVKVPSLTQKVKLWQWPVKGRIISKFSAAAQGNKGIDIAGKKGQKIKASADGLVVYAGNALRGYGNLIIIKHNDDYLSAYAHNDQLLVKEQQTVKAGHVIAKMGNTGTNKIMLHFEIRFRGKSVNPQRYLPK